MKIFPYMLLLMGIFNVVVTVAATASESNFIVIEKKSTLEASAIKKTEDPSAKHRTLLSDKSPVKSYKQTQHKLIESPELNQNNSGSVWQLFSGLFVVIVSIIVLVWLMKRFGRFSHTGQQTVKVLGGVSLGTREKVVLIEVGNEQLLIGVAPGRVNMLHQLQEPLEITESSQSFQSVFGQRFKDLFKRDDSK